MSKKINVLLVGFYIAVILFNAWTTVSAFRDESWVRFGIGFLCLIVSIACGHSFIKGLLFYFGIIKGSSPVIQILLTVDNKIHKIKMMKATLKHANNKTDCAVKVTGHGEELSAIMMAMALASLAESYGEEDLAKRLNEWLLKKNQQEAEKNKMIS